MPAQSEFGERESLAFGSSCIFNWATRIPSGSSEKLNSRRRWNCWRSSWMRPTGLRKFGSGENCTGLLSGLPEAMERQTRLQMPIFLSLFLQSHFDFCSLAPSTPLAGTLKVWPAQGRLCGGGRLPAGSLGSCSQGLRGLVGAKLNGRLKSGEGWLSDLSDLAACDSCRPFLATPLA